MNRIKKQRLFLFSNSYVRLSYKKRVFILVSLLFGYLICWALSTPTGSSPDDGYHLSSIWCVDSNSSQCMASGQSFAVPSLVAGSSYKCFAQWGTIVEKKYNQSAKCIESAEDSNSEVSYLNNNTGMYPKIFYEISNIFVGESVNNSVIKIRIFWGALLSLLLFISLISADKSNRQAMLLNLILYLSPVFAFLTVSTNPTSGSLIGLFFLPTFLSLCLSEKGKTKYLGVCGVAFSTLVAAGSRTDGGFFVVVILVAWAFINFKSKHKMIIFKVCSLSFVLAILLGLLVLKNSKSVGLQAVVSHPTSMLFNIDLLIFNILHLYEYYLGIWGLDWSLGWKYEPKLVDWISYAQGTITLTILGLLLRIRKTKGLLVLLYLVVVSLVVPLYMFQASGAQVGDFVQPRYILPFLLAATALLLANFSRNEYKYKNPLVLSAGLIFTISSISSYWAQITRVTRGTSGNIFRAEKPSDWWWEGFVLPPSVLFCVFVTLSMTLSFSICAELMNRKIKVRPKGIA